MTVIELMCFKLRFDSGFFSEDESLINNKENLPLISLIFLSIALDNFHNDFQSLYNGINI